MSEKLTSSELLKLIGGLQTTIAGLEKTISTAETDLEKAKKELAGYQDQKKKLKVDDYESELQKAFARIAELEQRPEPEKPIVPKEDADVKKVLLDKYWKGGDKESVQKIIYADVLAALPESVKMSEHDLKCALDYYAVPQKGKPFAKTPGRNFKPKSVLFTAA